MTDSNISRKDAIHYDNEYTARIEEAGYWDVAGKAFDAGDVDARHNFEAWDVPSWDKSDAAEITRRFARWKAIHPDRYAEIQNLYGDAQYWYEDYWEEEEERFPTYTKTSIYRLPKKKGKLESSLDQAHSKYTGIGFKLLTWSLISGVIVFIAAAISFIFISRIVSDSVLNIIFATASLGVVAVFIISLIWTILDFILKLASRYELRKNKRL